MNSVAISTSPVPWSDTSQVLTDVGQIAAGQLAPAAARIDGGYYPTDIMANLGQAGAFAGHLRKHGTRYDLAIASMQSISRHCGSTGFMTWCQDVCGLYMEESGNPALLARLDDHAAGRCFGGTRSVQPNEGSGRYRIHGTESQKGTWRIQHHWYLALGQPYCPRAILRSHSHCRKS